MHHPILPLSRILTLAGFGLLFVTLLFGIVFKKIYPTGLEGVLIFIMIVPMLFPLRGLLQAKRYTHAWGSFLSCWYIIIGVDVWQHNPIFSVIIISLTTIWFAGMVLYARFSPLGWQEVPHKKQKRQKQ